jgi:hypothetical protein
MLLVGVLGGGGAVLLGLVLFAGFVWPGFLLPSPRVVRVEPVARQEVVPPRANGVPKGTGNEDLLAFAPPDTTLVAGATLAFLKDQPEMVKQFQLGLRIGLQQAGASPAAASILGDVDRVLVTVNTNVRLDLRASLIMGLQKAYDPERIREALEADQGEAIQNKTFYRLTKLARGDPKAPVMYMPNDRVLVFAACPPDQLPALMNLNGAQPVVSADLLPLVRAQEKAAFWAVVQASGEVQQLLAQLNEKNVPIPELQPAVPIVRQLKAATFAIEMLPTQKTKFSIGAICAGAEDSKKLSAALDGFWKGQGQALLGMVKQMAPPDIAPTLSPVVDELTKSLTVTSNDSTTLLSIELSNQLMQKLAENAGRMQQMIGPGGPRMGQPQQVPAPQQVPPHLRPRRKGP